MLAGSRCRVKMQTIYSMFSLTVTAPLPFLCKYTQQTRHIIHQLGQWPLNRLVTAASHRPLHWFYLQYTELLQNITRHIKMSPPSHISVFFYLSSDRVSTPTVFFYHAVTSQSIERLCCIYWTVERKMVTPYNNDKTISLLKVFGRVKPQRENVFVRFRDEKTPPQIGSVAGKMAQRLNSKKRKNIWQQRGVVAHAHSTELHCMNG